MNIYVPLSNIETIIYEEIYFTADFCRTYVRNSIRMGQRIIL